MGVVGGRGRRMVNVNLQVVGLEPMTHAMMGSRGQRPKPLGHLAPHTHTQYMQYNAMQINHTHSKQRSSYLLCPGGEDLESLLYKSDQPPALAGCGATEEGQAGREEGRGRGREEGRGGGREEGRGRGREEGRGGGREEGRGSGEGRDGGGRGREGRGRGSGEGMGRGREGMGRGREGRRGRGREGMGRGREGMGRGREEGREGRGRGREEGRCRGGWRSSILAILTQ